MLVDQSRCQSASALALAQVCHSQLLLQAPYRSLELTVSCPAEVFQNPSQEDRPSALLWLQGSLQLCYVKPSQGNDLGYFLCPIFFPAVQKRSEERRVGKEC